MKENKGITYKIPSFTLIESIIAIVVIMICFWVSSMIYINIIRSDARLPRLKAFLETKNKLIETNKTFSYFEEESQVDSLRIVRTIENYPNEPELKILHLQAFNEKKKKLADIKQIVIAK